MGRPQSVGKQKNTGSALRRFAACLVVYLTVTAMAPRLSLADDPPMSPPATRPEAVATQPRDDLTDPVGPNSGPYESAPDAVRAANRRLLSGDPTSALEAYRHAEQLRPDAREIAFGEGLAHYELGEYDQAREAFRKAAVSGDDLAVDARYSLATCDHREALDKLDQPKEALGLLEQAMRQYRDVLTERPEHAPARDANYKAASMWREIKRQMQQQEQQKQQNGDQDKQDPNDDKQQQDSQKNKDQKDEQQDRDQQSQSQDKDQEQQQSEQQEQKQDQAKQKDDEQTKAKEQEAKQTDEKEQVSREQAERQLREMVQAMRDRKKSRRKQVEPVRVRPVDKDW